MKKLGTAVEQVRKARMTYSAEECTKAFKNLGLLPDAWESLEIGNATPLHEAVRLELTSPSHYLLNAAGEEAWQYYGMVLKLVEDTNAH